MKKNVKRYLITLFALAILAVPVATTTSNSISSDTQIIQPLNDYPDIPMTN